MKPATKQVEIEVAGSKLFGMLHTPQGNGQSLPLVIFLHGHGGNKIGPARFFVKAANSIASEGFAAFRFDFRGSGESQGAEEVLTTSSMLEDVEKVVEVLAKREKIDEDRIALVGHSWGGFVGLHFAAENDRIKALILWMGRTYDLKQALGQPWIDELKRRGYFYSGGVKLTERFYQDSLNFDSREAIDKLSLPVGMIYGGLDSLVLPSDGSYLKKHAQTETELMLLESLDHYFQGEENKQQILDYTRDWLETWLQ